MPAHGLSNCSRRGALIHLDRGAHIPERNDPFDDPAAIYGLLRDGSVAGIRGALLTLVHITGSSRRAIGAQMAVLEDGRFAGFLSGACLEPILAAQAILQIAKGRNRIVRLGAGSPFVDVRLPCGGGIDVLIDATVRREVLDAATDHIALRRRFCVASSLDKSCAIVDTESRAGWNGKTFFNVHEPSLRLIVAGSGPELEAVASVARGASIAVNAYTADKTQACRLAASGADAVRVPSFAEIPGIVLDACTALVLVFHEHEWEHAFLTQAG